MSIKLKLIKNTNAAYVPAPANQPTIVSSTIVALTSYSNTGQMLANDATTYANAVNYAALAAANAYANAVAYANTAVGNVSVSSLSDVVLSVNPPANNSTIVYNSANNKYVVKQLDVDGGTF